MELYLKQYQDEGNAEPLLEEYKETVDQFTKLIKGDVVTEPSLQWFYKQFLLNKQPTTFNINCVRTDIKNATYWCNREDARQQIISMVLTIAEVYLAKNYTVPFSKFLRARLPRDTRDWVCRYWNWGEYFATTQENPPEEEVWMEDVEPFKLDLSFVLYGNAHPLFKKTTGFDRYILFLYYAQEKNVREIAEITHMSRNTVCERLNAIVKDRVVEA